MAFATLTMGSEVSCGTATTAFFARFAATLTSSTLPTGASDTGVSMVGSTDFAADFFAGVFLTARLRAAFGSIAITPNPHLGTQNRKSLRYFSRLR